MTRLIFIFILFPLLCKGQSWTKVCVTQKGDTLNIGDSLKIIEPLAFKVVEYIYPKIIEDNGDRKIDVKWNAYKDHVSFMIGGTYPIVRMSRMKTKEKPKQYKPVVIIAERHADFKHQVEYIVTIDKALNAKAVEIIKKQQ